VGVKADAAQAAEWYRQAANAGDAEAADSLKRLLNGNGATASRMASSP
jgi:TPR repeat protein